MNVAEWSDKMKISIIVPIYNVQDYIEDCLNSIQQDLDGNELEVLCIDDCGSDNSIQIVESYKEHNPILPIDIIHKEKNAGLSEARNTGIRKANGDYILLLDSDDMLEKDCLKKIFHILKKENVDILECSVRDKIETKYPIIKCKSHSSEIKTATGDEFLKFKQEHDEYMPMSCIRIYRREFLIKTNLFTPGIFFEDEEFTPRILLQAGDCMSRNIPFYIYRRRENSITTNIQKNSKWIDDYVFIAEEQILLAKKNPHSLSYNIIINSASNLITSLIKNIVFYKLDKESEKKAFNMIRNKKLYNIPLASKSTSIKVQGYLMMNPNIFKYIYLTLKRMC